VSAENARRRVKDQIEGQTDILMGRTATDSFQNNKSANN